MLELLVEKSRPHEEVLDQVYLKYAGNNPFLPVTHFIDHVTMGPEALVALGFGARVEEWISHHRVRPYVAPINGHFDSANWKASLGRRDTHGDWLEYFERELERDSFQDVLACWVGRFAHDIGAFLFHGLIRTAYAVRALDHKDTPARRGELARGLALWAIGIDRGGADDGAVNREKMPAQDKDVLAKLLDFARIGAATLINDPNVPNVHLVTAPMAYHMIAHHLGPAAHRSALASFAETHDGATRKFESLKPKVDAAPVPSLEKNQIESLVTEWDAHPIKLTEAALRAFGQTQNDIFLKAAGKATSLHTLRGWVGSVSTLVSRRMG